MSKETTQDEIGRRRPYPRLVWIVVATLLVVAGVAVVLALALPGRAVPGAGHASDWPTESWATSTPEEQGMDSGKIEAMIAYIDEHDMAVDSIEGTVPAVSGVWICDVSGLALGVTYLTTEEMTPEELLAALERYLAGLTCH